MCRCGDWLSCSPLLARTLLFVAPLPLDCLGCAPNLYRAPDAFRTPYALNLYDLSCM